MMERRTRRVLEGYHLCQMIYQRITQDGSCGNNMQKPNYGTLKLRNMMMITAGSWKRMLSSK